MRITFSSLAGLQYITDGPRRYEAVHTPDGPEIYIAGTNERATLPKRVVQAVAERFDLVHMQDTHTQELLILEMKPCTI